MFIRIKLLVLLFNFAVFIAGCTSIAVDKKVSLTHGIDESAGGVDAYIVSITKARFFLEKEGGELSSLLDK